MSDVERTSVGFQMLAEIFQSASLREEARRSVKDHSRHLDKLWPFCFRFSLFEPVP
jgi:hypothetical protein